MPRSKLLVDVRRDGTAFVGETKLSLELSEVNPPLAKDIAHLEAAIAKERKALIENAAAFAKLDIPDLTAVPGAFEPGNDPYDVYADAVIVALEEDVSGGKVFNRSSFVATVRAWRTTAPGSGSRKRARAIGASSKVRIVRGWTTRMSHGRCRRKCGWVLYPIPYRQRQRLSSRKKSWRAGASAPAEQQELTEQQGADAPRPPCLGFGRGPPILGRLRVGWQGC